MSQPAYLLDTNVLSELMRNNPSAEVRHWFAQHTAHTMHISSVTQAEILTGIALLPEGQRRTALATVAQQMFDQDFASRCWSFDTAAAKSYAVIFAERSRLGLPVSHEDAQIAAIAVSTGLTLVTRNTKDFVTIAGLNLVNPWLPELPH